MTYKQLNTSAGVWTGSGRRPQHIMRQVSILAIGLSEVTLVRDLAREHLASQTDVRSFEVSPRCERHANVKVFRQGLSSTS